MRPHCLHGPLKPGLIRFPRIGTARRGIPILIMSTLAACHDPTRATAPDVARGEEPLVSKASCVLPAIARDADPERQPRADVTAALRHAAETLLPSIDPGAANPALSRALTELTGDRPQSPRQSCASTRAAWSAWQALPAHAETAPERDAVRLSLLLAVPYADVGR